MFPPPAIYNGGMAAVEITRREWAMALGGAVSAPSQPAASGESAEEILAEVQAEARRTAERLDGFSLPVSAEPAFIFKP